MNKTERHCNNIKFIEIFRNIRIILYTTFIILLYAVDLDFIEGRSLCVIYNIFDIKCITCGVTRALFNFSRGNIIEAIEYNPLIIIIIPVFLYLIIEDIKNIVSNKLTKSETQKLSIIEKIIMWIYKYAKN